MEYIGIIRELEYWDYIWIVNANTKEEAKKKILEGDGTIDDKRFVEGSDLSDREEAIRDIHPIIKKE